MNKQTTIVLFLCISVMALFISSCGAKYARPSRCVCEKPAAEVPAEVMPEKEESFRKVFEKKAQEEVFTIDFEKISKQSLFDFDSADISHDAYDNLDFVVKYMEENPGVRVSVEGHTDDVGTVEYNQTLSEKRARAVADYFIQKGIAPERVSSAGYGKMKPKFDNSTEEGRAQNRRTELVFTK